jgi:nucleotide-binding universal stress UspA family protein
LFPLYAFTADQARRILVERHREISLYNGCPAEVQIIDDLVKGLPYRHTRSQKPRKAITGKEAPMKVVAAVNGRITSEIAAFYALRYASLHGFPLILLHVQNPKDCLDDVEQSMVVIEEAAWRDNVTTERILLTGNPLTTIRRYLSENRIDTLFCSTSRHRNFFQRSLREQLICQPLPADLAVVQVVRLDAAHTVRNIVLAIEEDRLSVKKFAHLASFAKAYGAATEVYSVTRVDSKKLVELDIHLTRTLLRKINDRLSHYVKLARFMDITFRIKHAVARNEIDQVLHHLSHHDFQLMIVGGRRQSGLSRLFRSKPIDRLLRTTPINTIAFYGRDDG